MSTISEFTIPADSFPLGSAFENYAGITVELERIIPTSKTIIPYVWIHGVGKAEERQIEAAFEQDPEIRGIKLVDEVDGDYLLRVEWKADYTGILRGIAETSVALISAIGNSEQWTFELRGDRHADIATFQAYCHDHDLPVTLTELHSVSRMATDTEYHLTDTQREALVLAYEHGYYQSPRKTTLQEIADDLEITGQALGARLQGGIHRLIGSTLIEASEVS